LIIFEQGFHNSFALGFENSVAAWERGNKSHSKCLTPIFILALGLWTNKQGRKEFV
jgi:hypothetical protein